jgi:VanZ family protein
MKKHIFLILTILWMAVIFLFSSQNGAESGMNNQFAVELLKYLGIDLYKIISPDTAAFIIRKAAHLTEYFILGVLLYKTWGTYFQRLKVLSPAFIGFLYACTDEFHQRLVPGRGPSFRDELIDTSGVLIGVLLLWALSHRRKAITERRMGTEAEHAGNA